MSSNINIENNETNFSKEEDIFYKNSLKILNLDSQNLDSNVSKVISILKSTFQEQCELDVEESCSLNETIILNSSIIDYDTIFSVANHNQLLELFKYLCEIKNIPEEDYTVFQHLFYFISGALINERRETRKKITWNDFIQYLNLDTLSRTYHIREDFSFTLRQKLLDYFHTLPEFDLDEMSQEEKTYDQHFLNISQIKNIFYILDKKEINEKLEKLMYEIIHDNKTEHESPIVNYISDVLYNGLSNENQNNEINYLLSELTEQTVYINSGQVIYDLLDSLVKSNKEKFLIATDKYINIYWKQTETDIPYHISNLTLEDKTIAFFTTYFESIDIYGNSSASCFIELLLDFYNKDLFSSFMEHYNIPYNITIRQEITISDENNVEKTEQHYFSLFETALYQGKFNITDDLLTKIQVLEPFFAKITENEETYQYNYKPFFDLIFLEENMVLYLIEKNIFNQHTFLPFNNDLNINNEKTLIDIFYYLLNEGYDQAFLKLYTKSKTENPEFSLKLYQSHSTLLSLYLVSLKTKNIEYVNPSILSIFINENYSVYEKNADGYCAVDFIQQLTSQMAVHTIALLESLFKKEKPLMNTQSVTEEKPHLLSNLLVADNENYVSWFNRLKLEQHYKTISKDRDGYNREYIKTMLSNNNHMKKNLLIEDETFFDTLATKFPNFHEVINFYKGQFRLKKLTGKIHIPAILLLGEPGIGKTHFAKEFSQYLNTGYTFLDMGSITSNWLLTGNNGTWKGCKQGKILESIMKSKTVNPLILMDEIDKARSGEHDPTISLYQLLEEVNAKEFTDEFIDFNFDASGIIYIACANSIQNIPEPLLSRFKVFRIEKPSNAQLDNIIKNIYSDSIKNSNIFVEEIDPVIIQKLKSFSLRTIKVIIEDGISNALLEITPIIIKEKLQNNEKLSLTLTHLKDPQKKTSIGFHKV